MPFHIFFDDLPVAGRSLTIHRHRLTRHQLCTLDTGEEEINELPGKHEACASISSRVLRVLLAVFLLYFTLLYLELRAVCVLRPYVDVARMCAACRLCLLYFTFYLCNPCNPGACACNLCNP